VERQVSRALCALVVASACGCGLAREGLLAVVDPGDAAASADDGAVVDAIVAEDGPGSGDDGTIADALDEAEGGADVAPDARADARPDARADARPDAAADAPLDAPIDARADAPADAPSEAADARADAAPRPIVWDGGAIADPKFTDAAWVNLCGALVGCGHLSSMSACAALLHQPSSPDALIPPPDMITGIENASPTCSVVDDALDDGSACASTTPDTCSDNAVVTCRWGFRMTVDCGALGMVCSSGNENAGCGFGDCSAAQEGQTFCVGPSYLARCVSGRYAPELDCHTFGGACVGPAGAAQCQGTSQGPAGGPCTGGATCAGTSLMACLDGIRGEVDCAQAYGRGFTCLPLDGVDGGTPVCAAGTSCDPATFQDSCTLGAGVSFCNAGAPSVYDCLGNNWSGCAAGRCVP
jgi:hypothetical protein